MRLRHIAYFPAILPRQIRDASLSIPGDYRREREINHDGFVLFRRKANLSLSYTGIVAILFLPGTLDPNTFGIQNKLLCI